jgi:hypothetical protein
LICFIIFFFFFFFFMFLSCYCDLKQQQQSHIRFKLVFLVNKTNRPTELQMYWYYDSTCFGQLFRPSSGVLSRCTAKNSWWWAERPPETCGVVIPIKLEFSASVGFIYKEFITMHGHTILKFFSQGTLAVTSKLLRLVSV